MYSLGIVGSRTWSDYVHLKQEADAHLCGIQDTVRIISGGAKGADSLAERYAKEKGFELVVHKPEWNKYGTAAGFIRNELIVLDSDFILAFTHGSRGTAHTVSIANRNKVPNKVVWAYAL